MGPIGSPETSVSNQFLSYKNSEDGRIQFSHGGSLGSRLILAYINKTGNVGINVTLRCVRVTTVTVEKQ